MMRYTNDHKFSKAIAEAFRDIKIHDFVNPISSQPWRGRSRVIARIRIYEKYLSAEDVIQARWIYLQKLKNLSGADALMCDAGQEYLNRLLEERSAGEWVREMDDLYKSLPTEMDYVEAHLDKFGWDNLNLVGEIRKPKSPALKLVKKDDVRPPG